MEGETGGDSCYRRKKTESSWMRFYEHLMRTHVTRRMWRELSITRRADNVWANTYCRQFLVLGPFPANDKPAMGLDFPFIDEARPEAVKGVEFGGLGWRRVDTPGNTLDLARTFGPLSRHVAYAAVHVQSKTEQAAQLRIGSDDGCKVWHNGKLVISALEPRGAEPDQNVATVRLAKGDNLFLFKVANVDGGWAAILRLTDLRGGPLPRTRYFTGRVPRKGD